MSGRGSAGEAFMFCKASGAVSGTVAFPGRHGVMPFTVDITVRSVVLITPIFDCRNGDGAPLAGQIGKHSCVWDERRVGEDMRSPHLGLQSTLVGRGNRHRRTPQGRSQAEPRAV